MRNILLLLGVPDAGITATYYQAARTAGLKPVLVTTSRPRQGAADASDRLYVSQIGQGAILAAVDGIGRDRIAGVFAHGDATAEVAARVAGALGRPHADPDAISLCNDKSRLRAFLERRGLNTVDYRHATTASEVSAAVESLGGVLVVKPISSTGSNGVRVCPTPDEAVTHAERLLKRKRDAVLVERYIDAPQFAIELFDGNALEVRQSYAAQGPFPIIVGHDAPASVPPERLAEIKTYAASIAKEVGMHRGPAAVQLRDSRTEKYVMEINPRASLNTPVDIYTATGIDIAALCVKFACGLPYGQDLRPTKNRTCVTRFVVRNGSSVRTIDGLEEARKVPGVNRIHVAEPHFYRRGPATCAMDRIAAVYGESETVTQAAASAERAIEQLTIVYDRFPIDVIKFHIRKVSRLFSKSLDKFGSALSRQRGAKADAFTEP